MKKLTNIQIEIKIKVLEKELLKVNAKKRNEINTLILELRKRDNAVKAEKLIKHKYFKRTYNDYNKTVEYVYMTSLKINKRDVMQSNITTIHVFNNSISFANQTLDCLQEYIPIEEKEFKEAYYKVKNIIKSKFPHK